MFIPSFERRVLCIMGLGAILSAIGLMGGCGAVSGGRDILPSTTDDDLADPDNYDILASPADEPGKWNFEVLSHRTNPSSNGLTFRWDFGDGQQYEGASQTYVFSRGGTYQIQVQGIDNQGDVVFTLSLNIEVPEPANAPTVVLVESQAVFENESVSLDASGSSDPDGDELTFAWRQISGPEVLLSGADVSIASFVAPTVDGDARLVFELLVSDGVQFARGITWVDVFDFIDTPSGDVPNCVFTVILNDGTGDQITDAPFAGPRPLTVTATASIVAVNPPSVGTYTWNIDGSVESGSLAEMTVMNRVLGSAGVHTITLALTVVGTTVSCQSTQTGDVEELVTVWPMVYGDVKDASGLGVSGVTVSASGGGTTAVTDASGAFRVHVPYLWSGAVTAQHANYTFTPAQQTFNEVQTDIRTERFLATASENPIPPGCASNADCRDDLYCNGDETCVAGACVAGTNPCGPGFACNETANTCGTLAFEGFGAVSRGGAGGQIYHVTSLADSGPGTLRDGVSNRDYDVHGPRTIVFDVAGAITLQSDLKVAEPYLTIDGSTAPLPGITIRPARVTSTGYDGEFIVGGTHDIIIRHLRFWGLWQSGGTETNNAATILIDGDTGPDHAARNIVLDHITARNATDGGPDIWGEVSDVTVSWCLFFYNRHPTTVSHYPSPYQVRQRISMHHNVYAKNGERQPQLRADVRQFDFVNNVLYGWGYFGNGGYAMRVRNESGEPKVNANLINNYFHPTTLGSWALVYGSQPGPDATDGGPTGATPAQGTVVTTSILGSLFVAGNALPSANLDHYSTVSAPITIPTLARVTTYPANELVTRVVPNVGMAFRTVEEQALLAEIAAAMGGSAACAGNTDCADSLFCNGAETCSSGRCVAGANPCATGYTCDEAADRCLAPAPQCTTHAGCNNGIYCDGQETCVSGLCVAGANPCAVGQRCVESSGTCEQLTSGSWAPPIGIPEPPFGIRETVAGVYGSDTFYTHYVDNARACSDSNNGGRGSATAPRCTIPTTLAAGSVVRVHGGPYVSTTTTFSGTGTASQPIFVRGGDATNRTTIRAADIIVSGGYMIIENFFFQGTRMKGFGAAMNHVSFRQNEVQGRLGVNGLEVFGNDVVIYGNHIHHAGTPSPPDDRHGITVMEGSKRIWIVDNEINNNSGDAIQFCHGCTAAPPQNVYVGRNTLHGDVENAVDIKYATNVVISQNVAYDYHPAADGSTSSDGSAMVLGSDGGPDNVWVLFNEIRDSANGIRNEKTVRAWIIGNKIHNVEGFGIGLEKESADLYIVGNTIYNADVAISQFWREAFRLHIFNNVFANLRGTRHGNHLNIESSVVASASEMSNNLFWQAGSPAVIRWASTYSYSTNTAFATFPGGANNRIGDPMFVSPATDDLHLRTGSAAIDRADASRNNYVQTFCGLFGSLIPSCSTGMAVDFDKEIRSQGTGPDMGAFESP